MAAPEASVIDLSTFFLVIFIVALGLTLITFALGVSSFHIPGLHGGHANLHVDHVDVGHVAHVGHVDAPHIGHEVHAGHPDVGEGISPLNMTTILAFLTWFGGAGYLLTEYSGAGTILALAGAAAVGLVGAAIVFLFLTRVLLPGQTPYLSPDDFELTGTIGRLSVGIRGNGTGEVVYSKAGSRRVATARSEQGKPMARGTEVVIVRAEKGVAYVEPFEEFVQGGPRQTTPAREGEA
jgi:membrane protein implicated in regulation of membrane protease activity